jgi:hypothetical protein
MYYHHPQSFNPHLFIHSRVCNDNLKIHYYLQGVC